MKVNQMPNDCEAQAKTAVSARRGGIGLTEAVKDEREKLRADALPSVTYTDLKGCVSSFDSNFNPAAWSSELDRVSEEIPDHLLQAAGITHCMTNRRIERDLQVNAL